MSWLLVLLHTPRDVNIATVLLGTLAGLYGYYGILGKPGGLLRQLLVSAPSGAGNAVIFYLYDVNTRFVYSNVLREVLHIPPTFLPSPLLATAFGALLGIQVPLLYPNLLRTGAAKPTPASLSRLILGILIPLDGTLGTVVGIQVITLKLNVLSGWHPPFAAVIAFAASLNVIVWGTTFVFTRLPKAQRDAPDQFMRWRLLNLTIGCPALLLVLLAGLGFTVYLIARIGWGVLWIALLSVAFSAAVRLIQLVADNLKKDTLARISLVLFLLAAGLQIYQAVAA